MWQGWCACVCVQSVLPFLFPVDVSPSVSDLHTVICGSGATSLLSQPSTRYCCFEGILPPGVVTAGTLGPLFDTQAAHLAHTCWSGLGPAMLVTHEPSETSHQFVKYISKLGTFAGLT